MFFIYFNVTFLKPLIYRYNNIIKEELNNTSWATEICTQYVIEIISLHQIKILIGKRKSEGINSDEDTSCQKQQAYDPSTSSDEESRLSSRCGKKPTGGNQNKLLKELKGITIASIN